MCTVSSHWMPSPSASFRLQHRASIPSSLMLIVSVLPLAVFVSFLHSVLFLSLSEQKCSIVAFSVLVKLLLITPRALANDRIILWQFLALTTNIPRSLTIELWLFFWCVRVIVGNVLAFWRPWKRVASFFTSPPRGYRVRWMTEQGVTLVQWETTVCSI